MPHKTPPEIKVYAKELYMIPSPRNAKKHLYPFSYIAEKIEDRFNRLFTTACVCKWAIEPRGDSGFSWKEEFELRIKKDHSDSIRSEINTLIDDSVPVPHLLDAPKLKETEQEIRQEVKQNTDQSTDQNTDQEPASYEPEVMTPEIISREEATRREQEITDAIKCDSEKHYKNSIKIYEAEQDLIKVMLASYYGEAQRLIKQYGKATNIPTDVLNKSIPKAAQRLIMKDELARASQLAAMRQEGMGQQTKQIDYSKFTLAELMQIVATWEEIDEHTED